MRGDRSMPSLLNSDSLSLRGGCRVDMSIGVYKGDLLGDGSLL